MTPKWVEDQIRVIREASAEASVSKEAALAFLERAGIKSTPKVDHSKKVKSVSISTESSAHA